MREGSDQDNEHEEVMLERLRSHLDELKEELEQHGDRGMRPRTRTRRME